MFKDFAIIGVDPSNGNPLTDPVTSYVRNGAEVTSGAVGAGWTRPYVTFTPDREAKYLAVGARITSPNQATVGQEHLNAQYFTKWQLERHKTGTSGTPSAYSGAREVQILVKPDRINLITNPSFEVSTSGWGQNYGAVTRVAETPPPEVGGGWAMEYISATHIAGGTATYSNACPVKPGMSVNGSIWLKMQGQSSDYKAVLHWYNGVTGIGNMNVVYPATELSGTEWTRISITGEAPGNATAVRLGVGPVDAITAGNGFRVDGASMTYGIDLWPYFDGGFGDDFMWESGGTPGLARSYYYLHRLDRVEAIRRALRDSVPLGISVAEPSFAVWTG